MRNKTKYKYENYQIGKKHKEGALDKIECVDTGETAEFLEMEKMGLYRFVDEKGRIVFLSNDGMEVSFVRRYWRPL